MTTLRNVLDLYAIRKHLSKESVRKYRVALGRFDAYLATTASFEHLTEDTICAFQEWLRPLSPATINDYAGRLVILSNFATQRGFKDGWIELQPVRELRRRPRSFSMDQIDALLTSAQLEPIKIAGIPASDWLTALILVLYDTGWRIGAAMSLQWENVDETTRWIAVEAEGNSKKLADDAKQVHPQTMRQMLKIRGNQPSVFPWEFHASNIYKIWERVRRRAGVPLGRKWGFHAIRKTTLTTIADLEDDQAACDFAQHTSIQITRQFYIDPSRLTRRRQPCDVLPRPKAAS